MTKLVIEFTIEVVVEPDDDGFHAYCPALKGLHVGGDTKEVALQNAADATIVYIQSLIKHGDPIPLGVSMQTFKDIPQITRSRANRHTQEVKVACAI